jgi:predicted ABC-class ATPase
MDELNSELYNRSRPVEENGWYYFCEPGGEITIRNSAYFSVRFPRDYDYGSGITIYPWVGREVPKVLYLCLMIQVQLPYHKMKKTIRMLTSDLPKIMDRYIREFDRGELLKVMELSQRQHSVREFLKTSDYCAFIANGSILPRSKGTDLPMQGGVPFKSSEADEIEIAGVRGMGIKRGVTVITGGGYSGKSTLIDAIASGINNHVLGDGRELCITDSTAATVCAEDGRAISHVNISPFIKNIPGSDTSDFSTERASGSTSEAANIMEAVDAGSKLLLIDEDRSATNFMIRDPVMRRLIKDEPITPFTERVQELSRMGISTILVIGGSGEYLSVADKVYIMQGLRLQAERITPLPLPTGHSTRAFLRAGLILTPEGWERSGCGCSTSE